MRSRNAFFACQRSVKLRRLGGRLLDAQLQSIQIVCVDAFKSRLRDVGQLGEGGNENAGATPTQLVTLLAVVAIASADWEEVNWWPCPKLSVLPSVPITH